MEKIKLVFRGLGFLTGWIWLLVVMYGVFDREKGFVTKYFWLVLTSWLLFMIIGWIVTTAYLIASGQKD